MFLSDDIATQAGTMALVPQVVDTVTVPVIAAGGIGDGRGIAAAFAHGYRGYRLATPNPAWRKEISTFLSLMTPKH